ncbi:MAG: hypothetical protein ACRDYZ_01435 [Acidimicrobiales bacterium]
MSITRGDLAESRSDGHSMLTRLESHRARFLSDAGRWRHRAACRGMGPELFFPPGEWTERAHHVASLATPPSDGQVGRGRPRSSA